MAVQREFLCHVCHEEVDLRGVLLLDWLCSFKLRYRFYGGMNTLNISS